MPLLSTSLSHILLSFPSPSMISVENVSAFSAETHRFKHKQKPTSKATMQHPPTPTPCQMTTSHLYLPVWCFFHASTAIQPRKLLKSFLRLLQHATTMNARWHCVSSISYQRNLKKKSTPPSLLLL